MHHKLLTSEQYKLLTFLPPLKYQLIQETGLSIYKLSIVYGHYKVLPTFSQ